MYPSPVCGMYKIWLLDYVFIWLQSWEVHVCRKNQSKLLVSHVLVTYRAIGEYTCSYL